jgi:hypothetical protein
MQVTAMYSNNTTNGNALAIRPVKQLQSAGKKLKLSWLRRIFKRIKIDQKALRQTLEITFR